MTATLFANFSDMPYAPWEHIAREHHMQRFWLFLFALTAIFTSLSADSAKKKVLILIIASDNHPAFLELQEVWQSYMNSRPEEITAYFIKGDPLLESDSEQMGNTLYTKTLDNYKPGILKKTILSLAALEKELDGYEYILRTNLSSVYDYTKLLEFCQTLPKERCYAARPLFPSYEVPAEYSKIPFGWGAGFIMSPDLAKLIVKEKEKLYARINDIPDDVMIGALFHEHQVPIIPVPFLAFTTRPEWEMIKNGPPQNVFHYRAKSHYLTRKLDDAYEDELFIASEIAKKLYPGVPLTKTYQSTYPLEIALKTVYEYHAAYPSAINEYLPQVKALASECASCVELGNSEMIWSWALAEGLAISPKEEKSFVAIFDKRPACEQLLLANRLMNEHNIGFSFRREAVLVCPIPSCDLLLVDCPYPFTQLVRHANSVQKYIVLHVNDDMRHVVSTFLSIHPEWKLKEQINNFVVLNKGD